MSSRSADSQLFQARNCPSPICTLYAFFYINMACIFLQHLWQTIGLLQECRNFAKLNLCCLTAGARAMTLVSWTMCGIRSWENPGALCNCLILGRLAYFLLFRRKTSEDRWHNTVLVSVSRPQAFLGGPHWTFCGHCAAPTMWSEQIYKWISAVISGLELP